MRYIQKECLPHPLAPLLYALGVAGGAEPPGAAGKHQEVFFPTVGTADAGEAAARVPAVQVALLDFLDNRPEEAVLSLEAVLIFSQEPVEVMEQYPINDSALGMTRTIDS